MRTEFNKSDLFIFVPITVTIVFVVLKLMGEIDWHWLIVLSPILIPIIISVALYIVATLILKLYKDDKAKKK